MGIMKETPLFGPESWPLDALRSSSSLVSHLVFTSSSSSSIPSLVSRLGRACYLIILATLDSFFLLYCIGVFYIFYYYYHHY